MARMMHLFRKYQYILLVVFGVLLMFVFVVGDALNQLATGWGGPQAADNVVLTWKNGKLTDSELYNMRVQHNMAMEFLNAVAEETVNRDGSPKGLGTQMGQATSDEELIRKMLLAAKAESLGLRIDNDAVFNMLYELGDGELTRSDFNVLFNQIFADRRGFTQQRLMDQLQQEMLAQQMLLLSQTALIGQAGPVLPPYKAWELYSRMHRRLQTELVALNVKDFVDKVTGQPSDAEIQALYEAGKNQFRDPLSPEPGFRRRERAVFEYVRADYDKFVEEEAAKIKDTITDQEIEAYYEENKERYRILDLPTAEPSTDEPASSEAAKDESASPNAAEPRDTSQDTETDEKPEVPAATEPSRPADTPESAVPTVPEATPKDEAAVPDEESGAMLRNGGSLFVSLRVQDSTAESDAPTNSQEETGQAETSAAETAVPVEGSENATPATEAEPATSQPPNAENAEVRQPSEGETSATESGEDEAEYKPLDDALRAEIREQLAKDRAREPAQQRLDRAFNALSSAIENYGRQVRQFDDTSDVQRPEPVALAELAAEHGLTAGKTDMVDALTVEEYELGRSYQFSFAGRMPQRIPFAQLAFQEGIQLYRPARIQGADFNIEFLYWKTEEEPGYIPELEDVRKEVADEWRLQRAFALAKAEAEKLAKEAASDKPLGDALGGGYAVIEPPPFSWMTTGFTPFGASGAPALSEVQGVEGAGTDFMQAVFGLPVGGTGVAVNQPHSVVYVARVAGESPSEETLRNGFLASGVTNEMNHMAFMEIGQLWQNWYQDLEREMQVVRRDQPAQL